MITTSASTPVTPRRLLALTAIAALGAATLTVLVVLPAEFHRDPTGFGRLTGLDRLSPGPAAARVSSVEGGQIARSYAAPFRIDTIDIPLASGDLLEGSEIEWKVRMTKGQSLVYAWSVSGLSNPGEFYSDFHGHSPPKPKLQVATYRQGIGASDNGSLTAPFDGIHGWYLQNQSAGPVVVHLKLSGFYALVSAEELARMDAEARAAAESSSATAASH
jgi:hypothetical protein